MIRRATLAGIVLILLASPLGVGPGPASPAGPPTELWKAFPLDPTENAGPATAPAAPPVPAAPPASPVAGDEVPRGRADASPPWGLIAAGSVLALAALAGLWLALRAGRRRRPVADAPGSSASREDGDPADRLIAEALRGGVPVPWEALDPPPAHGMGTFPRIPVDEPPPAPPDAPAAAPDPPRATDPPRIPDPRILTMVERPEPPPEPPPEHPPDPPPEPPPEAGAEVLRSRRELAELAAEYLASVASGSTQPVVDLAAARDWTVSRTRARLRRARELGILASGGAGRAGGELTEAGRALLVDPSPRPLRLAHPPPRREVG